MTGLDASAVLALVHDEPGAEIVAASLPSASLGAANLDEVIDLGEQVAGDEDRAAGGGTVPQQVAQPADALRVEPVAGLLEHEHEHGRVAEQRGTNAESLTHAEAVAAHVAVGGRGPGQLSRA